MKENEFKLDELKAEVRTWLSLIAQARRTPEGEIVPSFIEIIKQIDTVLKNTLKSKSVIENLKQIFSRIAIIQYLNDKYAIEKVMTFAKEGFPESLKPPSELVSHLTNSFLSNLSKQTSDNWDTVLGKSMCFLLRKDFKTARNMASPLNSEFKERYNEKKLFLLEALIYSLIRKDLIPLINGALNEYMAKFAQEPLTIYFSILRNLLYEIQFSHKQRKSALQHLQTFFNNLSQLE